MSAYKPGDRVRVTFEGTADERGLPVGDGVRFRLHPPILAHASIEVLTPPEPRNGSVALDRLGDGWQRYDDEWTSTLGNSLSYTSLIAAFGPLTLIHDPEATA